MTNTEQDGESSKYILGHTKYVANIHSGRSLARNAAFLQPHLRPDMNILDVGCGQGSLTCDLAEGAAAGHVTGIDLSPTVIDQARQTSAERKIGNATFASADILDGLPFADQSFDLVFCHTLLNHLSDPVKALREMKRLCKHDGILACREGIGHMWYPDHPALQDMGYFMADTMIQSGTLDPGAGRRLHAWALEVGFDPSLVTFTISGAPNMGRTARLKQATFWEHVFGEGKVLRIKAEAAGVSRKRITDFLDALKVWAENEEAFQVMICGEIICKMAV